MSDESKTDSAERLATESAVVKAEASQPAKTVGARLSGVLTGLFGEDPMDREGNPYADYLSRAIMLEEGSPPRNARAVITLVSTLFLTFIIWASITDLDERAVARGEILPLNFVQPIQHLEGGIVGEVLVRDGDTVKAGDAILVLDETAPRAEFQSLQSRHATLSLEVERLRAFAGDRPADFSAFAENFGDLVADHQNIMAAQKTSRDAQVGVIRRQIADLEGQIEGYGQQELALAEEVSLASEEVTLREELLEKGLTSKVVYLAARRALARAEGQLADIRTRRNSAGASAAEARQRIIELVEGLREKAFADMGRAAALRAEVEEQLARLRDRVRRTTVTAPISGTVQGLLVTQAGGVIGPGQVIAEIVPNEQALIAEVRISPRDIGHVGVGSRALLKIETYDFARYGGLEGVVEQVSASSFRDEEGNAYFRGLIRFDQDYVGNDPRSNRLTPGMTLFADIKTGEKSLIAYLIRPVYNTLSGSFGER